MENLLQFVKEKNDEINYVIERIRNTSSVQGLVVDYDKYWQLSFIYRYLLGYDILYRFPYAEWDGYFSGMLNSSVMEFLLREYIPRIKYDMQWEPHDWNYYIERAYGSKKFKNPRIILKICVKPNFGNYNELRFNELSFPVVFEIRPLAYQVYSKKFSRKIDLPLIGGVSVGNKLNNGTLGAILNEKNGKKLGITSAHVAREKEIVFQPSPMDSSEHRLIGKCISSVKLVEMTNSSICNPFSNDKNTNDIDAAIIDVDKNVNSLNAIYKIGTLNGYTNKYEISSLETVEVTGKSSGYNKFNIGGLGLVYLIHGINGDAFCFKNLFEIKDYSYLFKKKRIESGDSGAFVCKRDSEGIKWCGMIVGCDNPYGIGYATFSEETMNWIEGNEFNIKW